MVEEKKEAFLVDMNHELNKPSGVSSGARSQHPPLLNLRGTFLFPGQQADLLETRSHNLHAVPINQNYLVLHTEASVALHHLPTRTLLWRIVCPSYDFALQSQQHLLALAPGDPAPAIVLWDLHTGQIRRTLAYEKDTIQYYVNPNGLAFSPNGHILAAGMEGKRDKPVVLWDVSTGQVIQTLDTGERADITTLAFHPGGELLAGGSFNNIKVWIWSLADGHLVHVWDYPEEFKEDYFHEQDRPYDIAFHPEGTWLFAACGEGGLRVWDVEQQCEKLASQDDLDPMQVTVAPDGQSLAVAHFGGVLLQDRVVRVLEVGTWRVLHEFMGTFPSESFSPDGQVLATLDEHGSIFVWQVATEQLLYTL